MRVGRYLADPQYTFQMAFTNPLYDPIQIRLTQPIMPKNAPPANHHLHIPTQHFTVNAFKDAWAYDEDEEDEDILPGLEGSEGLSEEGSTFGTLGRRSRKSLLVTGSTRDKKRADGGVEKKGNVSKVGLEIEVAQGAIGRVEVSWHQFDDVDAYLSSTLRCGIPTEQKTQGRRARTTRVGRTSIRRSRTGCGSTLARCPRGDNHASGT